MWPFNNPRKLHENHNSTEVHGMKLHPDCFCFDQLVQATTAQAAMPWSVSNQMQHWAGCHASQGEWCSPPHLAWHLEIERGWSPNNDIRKLYMYVYICIYIYIWNTLKYIYIYIYVCFVSCTVYNPFLSIYIYTWIIYCTASFQSYGDPKLGISIDRWRVMASDLWWVKFLSFFNFWIVQSSARSK